MRIFKTLSFMALAMLLVLPSLYGQFQGKGRLSGEVVDEMKNPVAGANVVLVALEGSGKPIETKTNKKGKWAVGGLGTGMHKVKVSAEEFATMEQEVYVSQLDRNATVTTIMKKTQPAGSTGPENLELVEQGNKLYDEKNYDQAIGAFQQFLEKNPGAFQTHINIGNCFREKGEFDKALEEYNLVVAKVRETKPNLKGDKMAGKGLAAIGEIHMRKGDLATAQDFFKQSLDVSPSDETLAYNVGEIYFSNGKVDEAIQYFSLALQIKPDWLEACLKLGYSYLNKADYEKAAEYMKKYLELAPQASNAEEIRKILDSLPKK